MRRAALLVFRGIKVRATLCHLRPAPAGPATPVGESVQRSADDFVGWSAPRKADGDDGQKPSGRKGQGKRISDRAPMLDSPHRRAAAQDGAAGAPQRASGLCGQLTGVGAKLATHSRFALTPRKNAAIFFFKTVPATVRYPSQIYVCIRGRIPFS
jgi:hypothetical protein